MAEAISVEVEVIADATLPPEADPDALANLIRWVLAELGASGEWSVTVALIDDEALRALHRDFMGDDSVTDVMTFPSGESSLTGGGGDVAISVERAVEQGPEWDHSAWQEIRFLAVHGVLHLCGWDDRSAEERERMLAEQRRLIERYEATRAASA